MSDEILKYKMVEDLVVDIPQFRRGRVWCTVCERTMKVDSGECLENGWPKCCGYTMTIDSPDEHAARAACISR